MKKFNWVCIPMVLIALAMVFTGCSGNEGTTPQAQVNQNEAAQPDAQAAQPSEAAGERAQIQTPVPASQPVAEPETAANEPVEVTKPEVAEIMGTVMDDSGKILISIDNENYAVTGQDLSGMVGKTVRVLGSLQEDEGQKTITVISVVEVQ